MGLCRTVDAGLHGTPRVVVMAGPSGVGKTTTAIKLAAVQAMRQGQKVALMTLDDRRIGALEQLRIYSRLLEVPLAAASSPEDAREALKGFQAMDCTIVDTPGISPGEENRRFELQQVLEPLKSKEVHLVLNASTCERDLGRIIDDWKGFPVDRLAFTRLDEAGTWGCLLNLLVRTRIPLSYISTGPRIPDDLAEAPLELVIDRLWPVRDERIGRRDSQQPARNGSEALSAGRSSRFVANRNSDLYHRPECKRALKIKRGNLIQFASAEEAESRHFVPCRSCSPDGAAGEAASRDGKRISGYR
jgi:flagellar biosynthesis protein FlhF